MLAHQPLDLDGFFIDQGLVLPEELEERMCYFVKLTLLVVRIEAEKLGAIEVSDILKGRVRQKDIDPDFRSTINCIADLLKIKDSKVAAKQEKIAKAAMSVASSNIPSQTSISSGSTSTSLPTSNIKSRGKRPAPEPLPLDSKRSRLLPPGPPTPDNPTQPADPNDTGGTTTSTDEETTKKLLDHLIGNTLSALDLEFTQLRFSKSPCRVELKKTYIHFFQMLI